MIVQLEAYNYRCLRLIRQPLNHFHVLIGPNASGKSTFLDIVGFMQDVLLGGLDLAIYGTELELDWFVPRTQKNFRDLLHKGQGQSFTLAVVMGLPSHVWERPKMSGYNRCRYQIRIGYDARQELMVLNEALWLLEKNAPSVWEMEQVPLWEDIEAIQDRLWKSRKPRGWKQVLDNEVGLAHFWSETTNWNFPLRLAPDKPALANLPEDEERFPASVWLKGKLRAAVWRLQLNPRAMREPCPALASSEFELDGSNLPKVLKQLKESEPKSFEWWLRHVQVGLSDLEDVEVREREEDRSLYLVLRYRGGYEVKQWSLSDGTLRFLALTLIAYLSGEEGAVWLIEEPENGIHPTAIELVLQSLTGLQESQVLIATHSPVVLGLDELVKPEHLLCFRLENGETSIRSGTEIPALQERKRGTIGLDVLFATGVL